MRLFATNLIKHFAAYDNYIIKQTNKCLSYLDLTKFSTQTILRRKLTPMFDKYFPEVVTFPTT